MPNTDKMILLPQLQRYDQKIKGWADNKFLTKTDTPSLPKATATTLGGVKVGNGLNVTDDGTLSVETHSSETLITTSITATYDNTGTWNADCKDTYDVIVSWFDNYDRVFAFVNSGANSLRPFPRVFVELIKPQEGLIVSTPFTIQYVAKSNNPRVRIGMTTTALCQIYFDANGSIDFQMSYSKVDQYADATEFTNKVNGSVSMLTLKDGGITGAKIEDSSIGSTKLKPSSVTRTEIADNAIEGNHIRAGEIDVSHIKDASVTSAKLALGAVDTKNIKEGAITTATINDGAIKSAKLADGAVTVTKLTSGAVNEDTLADGAVTRTKIANGTITAAKLASRAVTTDKIADGAITKAKLASDVIVNASGAGNSNLMAGHAIIRDGSKHSFGLWSVAVPKSPGSSSGKKFTINVFYNSSILIISDVQCTPSSVVAMTIEHSKVGKSGINRSGYIAFESSSPMYDSIKLAGQGVNGFETSEVGSVFCFAGLFFTV